MKKLPLIASLLYCQAWHILPQYHVELGQLYRNYIDGKLDPKQLEGADQVGSGLAYQVDSRSGIALIHVNGIIVKRAQDSWCGPRMADLAKMDLLFKDIRSDDSINTVVMDFHTPGGSAIGLPETTHLMQSCQNEGKRFVAYTDMLCASAGYWLAAQCDEIYASPSAQVGSVGTYIAAIDDSRAWEMEGLELKLFRDGALKAIGHPGKQWTEEEEAYMVERVAYHSAKFKDHVRERRPGIEEDTMQGQCHTGEVAPAGLIDGVFMELEELLAAEMDR